MLRYREVGNLHKDFHASCSLGMDFLVEKHGEKALAEVLYKMGTQVYASIHNKLKNDDPSELLEHLAYFYNREEAEFTLKVTESEIVLTVSSCPAVAHVRQLGLPLSRHFCPATAMLNAALCHDTPWESETRLEQEGQCVQRFYRKEAQA